MNKMFFRGIEDYPSENTLTVNITHQQLDSLNPPFDRLVAIAPSRYQEGTLSPTSDPGGYDVKLETAKEIVFQHKAPANTVVRAGKKWLNYVIDMRQMSILYNSFGPRQAFYALPATPQRRHIRQGLERTIFVDVYPLYQKHLAIGEDISRIYVEYLDDPGKVPEIKGRFRSRKENNRMDGYPYWDIRTFKGIFGEAMSWEPIENSLKDCRLGIPIRGSGIDAAFAVTEFDPPGFQAEYFQSLHPAYLEHVKQRYALDSYVEARGSRQELFEWMVTSLQNRLEAGRYQDWEIGGAVIDFSIDNVSEELRSDLQRLSESRHAPMEYLTDTRRCVMEKGVETFPITV